jgi:phage repressor protein C with HTH and peptisase S24 domain
MRNDCRMSQDLLLQRIEDRLKATGLSERKACLKAGLKVDAIRTIRRGNHPRASTLRALAAVLGVSSAYLLDASDDGPTPPQAGAGARASEPGSAMVPIIELDVRAGAGGGALNNDETETGRWHIPGELVRSVTTAPVAALRILTVYGDSMEPEFRPGQRVMVDSSDQLPSPPGVFVAWDGLATVIKRVEFVPHSDPPRVRFSSDNPRYQPYERTLEEAHIRGRVIGRWTWT